MERSTLLLLLLVPASFTTQAFSEEVRKFTSAVGTKTFEGGLGGNDQSSGIVEVMRVGVGAMKFPLSVFSEAETDH